MQYIPCIPYTAVRYITLHYITLHCIRSWSYMHASSLSSWWHPSPSLQACSCLAAWWSLPRKGVALQRPQTFPGRACRCQPFGLADTAWLRCLDLVVEEFGGEMPRVWFGSTKHQEIQESIGCANVHTTLLPQTFPNEVLLYLRRTLWPPQKTRMLNWAGPSPCLKPKPQVAEQGVQCVHSGKRQEVKEHATKTGDKCCCF